MSQTKPFAANLTAACVRLCREKDIEHFLETSRNKFIGFTLGKWVSQTPSTSCFCPLSCCFFFPSDVETLVGLPRPIHESVKTLKQVKEAFNAHPYVENKESVCEWLMFYPLQHKYVSIAEVQIKREEELQQCPLTLVSSVNITGFKLQ